MIGQLLDFLKDWASGVIGDFGYLGVGVLMLLDSANIPIPSEVTMPFGGILASEGRLTFHGVAWAGTIGSVLGSWLSYAIGALLGRDFLRRYGKYVLLRPKEIEHAERWWERYGLSAVFFGRFVPVVRTFISLPAGIYRAPLVPFTLYTLAGSVIWCYLWAALGYWLGTRWDEFSRYWHYVDYAVLAIIVVLLVRYIATRRRTNSTVEAPEPVE